MRGIYSFRGIWPFAAIGRHGDTVPGTAFCSAQTDRISDEHERAPLSGSRSGSSIVSSPDHSSRSVRFVGEADQRQAERADITRTPEDEAEARSARPSCHRCPGSHPVQRRRRRNPSRSDD
jgi:hypothetical protein